MWDQLTTFAKLCIVVLIIGLLAGLVVISKPVWQPIARQVLNQERPTPNPQVPTLVPVAIATAVPTAAPKPTTALPTAVPVKPTVVPAIQPTPRELPRVVVGIDAFASYYNVILIKTFGFDQKYGFNLEIIPFCSTDSNCYTEEDRSAKMSSGEWDAICTTLDKPVLVPNAGKVTVLVDETDGSDKIYVNPKVITTINDLKGKRISYAEGSVGEFYVYYLLNLVQIKPEDVQLFPTEDVVSATDLFVKGWVDAVSGWEPDVDAAADVGGVILIDSSRLRVPIDVLVFSYRSLNERPEIVQAFHDAWFEALKFQFENPQSAEQSIIGWGNNDWSYVVSPGDLTDEEAGWLTTIAQAGLGANQIAMQDLQDRGKDSILYERIEETRRVWRWAGKQIADYDPAAIVDTRFALSASQKANLATSRPPVNDTFILTGRPDLPKLSQEELGGATTVAVLPLRKIEFESNSSRLTEEAQKGLKEQVLPVLKASPSLYLKIEGSSAWPGPSGRYTETQIKTMAYNRALASAMFLNDKGVDLDRLILETVPPKYPLSVLEAELEQDRYCRFTLVQPLGR